MAVVCSATGVALGLTAGTLAAGIVGGAVLGAGAGALYSAVTGDGNVLNSALTGAAIGGSVGGLGAWGAGAEALGAGTAGTAGEISAGLGSAGTSTAGGMTAAGTLPEAAGTSMLGPTGVADVAAADSAASQYAVEQALQNMGTGALKNAGMTAMKDVMTGKPITPGQLASSAITGTLGAGINSAIPSVAETGLNPIVQNAGIGAIKSELSGGNPITGAISGAANAAIPGTGGLVGSAAGALTNAALNSNNNAAIAPRTQNIVQTGLPNAASTTASGVSNLELPNNINGIPSGSNVNMNTGTASNMAPSSGLNASGLPAQLASGVLTSSAAPASQNNTAQIDQLKQLYPQLSTVDPRILSSLVSSPVTMKEGGIVKMASGGSPQYEAVQQLLGIPQVKESAAEQAAYGNPTGSHRRQLVATHFINGLKDGGGIHSLEYGAHVPEFVTGKTGHYVKGKGDGQSDDIPAMLADGEYVFDADTVASLGNGSSDAGSKVLDKMREEIRKHKRSASPKEIPPKAKSPLEYMKGKK